MENTGSRKDRGTDAAVYPVRGGLRPSPALVAAWAWTKNTLRFCKTNQFPGDSESFAPLPEQGREARIGGASAQPSDSPTSSLPTIFCLHVTAQVGPDSGVVSRSGAALGQGAGLSRRNPGDAHPGAGAETCRDQNGSFWGAIPAESARRTLPSPQHYWQNPPVTQAYFNGHLGGDQPP